MLFLMSISLYTTRVILNALGMKDFGIYNVVGGVVTMFSVLSIPLTGAITRFLTFELGTGNLYKLKKVFSSAVTIQMGIALIVIVLAETVGLWFLNTEMNFPENRKIAANWVFQFSVLTFVINLISIPYNACIVAHERMSAFAYISILEGVGKLGVAYLIVISPLDKLIFYAFLMCIIALSVRLTYGIYCKKHFEECTYHFSLDKDLLNRMFSFAGWIFVGVTSSVLRDQGGNVVINLFCGPAVNAARGIASQVNNAISGFVNNFMTALNPQITKSYAAGEMDYMMTLIYQGARLSFYMLLLLSLPVLINTHYILTLWLKVVPDHTVLFVQLVLVFTMSESISNPLITSMLATGKIRNYQLVVGGLQMMNLPLSYILLRAGMFPEMVIVIAIVLSQCCLAARLVMLRGMIGLSAKKFIKNVYINVLMVTLIAIIIPFLLTMKLDESFQNFILSCFMSFLCTGITIFYVGCNKSERQFVITKIHLIIDRLK